MSGKVPLLTADTSVSVSVSIKPERKSTAAPTTGNGQPKRERDIVFRTFAELDRLAEAGAAGRSVWPNVPLNWPMIYIQSVLIIVSCVVTVATGPFSYVSFNELADGWVRSSGTTIAFTDTVMSVCCLVVLFLGRDRNHTYTMIPLIPSVSSLGAFLKWQQFKGWVMRDISRESTTPGWKVFHAFKFVFYSLLGMLGFTLKIYQLTFVGAVDPNGWSTSQWVVLLGFINTVVFSIDIRDEQVSTCLSLHAYTSASTLGPHATALTQQSWGLLVGSFATRFGFPKAVMLSWTLTTEQLAGMLLTKPHPLLLEQPQSAPVAPPKGSVQH